MPYHRFTNLREIFQGDLSRKLTEGVLSDDFLTLDCNCRDRETQGCDYNNVCRNPIVVYKAECKKTKKFYIGNTQCFVKTRMQGHQNDVRRLYALGQQSDSYAKHFASLERYTIYGDIPTPEEQRKDCTISVLWQGNPISAVKTFATHNCALCTRERLAILKVSRSKPELLINSCDKIYGACKHKPKFHRFTTNNSTSTDESQEDGKVVPTEVTTEASGRCLVDV